MSDAGAPPILTQRRIEAAFAKGVYEEMKAELGEETAKRILSSAVIKLAKQAAAGMAKDAPGFWESLGYNNYGDPWREQRYWGD